MRWITYSVASHIGFSLLIEAKQSLNDEMEAIFAAPRAFRTISHQEDRAFFTSPVELSSIFLRERRKILYYCSRTYIVTPSLTISDQPDVKTPSPPERTHTLHPGFH